MNWIHFCSNQLFNAVHKQRRRDKGDKKRPWSYSGRSVFSFWFQFSTSFILKNIWCHLLFCISNIGAFDLVLKVWQILLLGFFFWQCNSLQITKPRVGKKVEWINQRSLEDKWITLHWSMSSPPISNECLLSAVTLTEGFDFYCYPATTRKNKKA